ncbi:MAG: hypothetical protein HQM04_05625 [Magnetococcales bacterium]|nr:hypothetical protein [Magnetococcales bacterium]MBF0114505.1 hypothetical protein [Magnetococcales bacterium]
MLCCRKQRALFSLLLALFTIGKTALAGESCRLGFDVGSSGIRVAMLHSPHAAKVPLDYLHHVWRDNHLQATIPATVAALQQLPRAAQLPEGCTAVAGGYSAWRLAVERGGAAQAADTLQAIQQQSGVFFFIIPQDVEGSYGYQAVQQQMGERLTTPFVLDIGGGSLQFASADAGWGSNLGQKSWRKRFCQQIKQDQAAECRTNPVGVESLDSARSLLAQEIRAAQAALGSQFAVTALSAPVTRGIHPILRHLAEQRLLEGTVDERGFERSALAAAFTLLASKSDAQLREIFGNCASKTLKKACDAPFIETHVTDMLLLLLFMDGLHLDRMEVIEADMNNVPGLLLDQRVQHWSQHYPCYLTRLRQNGIDAFKRDNDHCSE